jgi:Zn-dependent oligopeptidase
METHAKQVELPAGEISTRLAQLQAQFSKNVLEAESAWTKHAISDAQLEGISSRAKEAVRDKAKSCDCDGFLLTLDSQTYETVLRHADDRDLRHELYEAYVTRASNRGPLAGRFDNGPLVEEILALRHDLARRLGFENAAQVPPQAAESPDEAERFLLELNSTVRPSARADLEEIWAFAKSRDGLRGFRPWDLPYYAEKLNNHKLGEAPPPAKQEGVAACQAFHRELTTIREIELALFDLRLHRDYVPAERSSRLRSHVLDTFAQVRREVSLLPPPPWDRTACALEDVFGSGQTTGYYRRLWPASLRR